MIDTTGELVLDGRYSIIGRSVVIHAVDGTNFECGTIRSAEDNTSECSLIPRPHGNEARVRGTSIQAYTSVQACDIVTTMQVVQDSVVNSL